MFEEERLMTVGCRTTCLRKNLVGEPEPDQPELRTRPAKAQNQTAQRSEPDPGADGPVCRFPGAVEASSGNTVNPVLDPAVFPAMGTGSVWTEPTELDFVSVTKVSTEPPVKRVRVASSESTVTRVGRSTVPPGRPPLTCLCGNRLQLQERPLPRRSRRRWNLRV